RLDANALFYLRSRGLPEALAQQLLTAAFCREPLAFLADPEVMTALTGRLDTALASAGVA
ncbi:MAG: Fe-S cluster assembly protein SufD, partial [Lysobacteraceae bacterium]